MTTQRPEKQMEAQTTALGQRGAAQRSRDEEGEGH